MYSQEQEGPFLRAGGTEIEPLTAERAEEFIPAIGITALDAGDALGVVASKRMNFSTTSVMRSMRKRP
jgi:hypothetical protein